MPATTSSARGVRRVARVTAWLAAGLAAAPALAHHGVAGVGAAALEGPGAPVESASSATLPQGRTLLYFKLDHARYETFDPDPTVPEAQSASYWMLGVGYGFTPWLSGYVFLPYHDKRDEPGGLDSRGWADMSVFAQLGFAHDGAGLRLVPAVESLDDLEDWHFTAYAGASLPTGDADHRLADGSIDPGKSLGFGKPAAMLGLTATKMLTRELTLHLEGSIIRFQTYTYADGTSVRFGDENRLNASLAQRLHADAGRQLRVDGIVEAQLLGLGRDVENGAGAPATGGRILYLLPGVRAYVGGASVALGVKVPVWTRLNEEAEQQGAEGTERYRLIVSASLLF